MMIAISTAMALAIASPQNGADGSSTSGSSQAPTETAKQDPSREKVKKKCKMQYMVDSRIPRRVCRTLEEWELEERNAQAVQDERNRNSSCTGSLC